MEPPGEGNGKSAPVAPAPAPAPATENGESKDVIGSEVPPSGPEGDGLADKRRGRAAADDLSPGKESEGCGCGTASSFSPAMRGSRRGRNGGAGFEGIFLSVSRRKRASLSKRGRKSTWGLLGDIRQLDQSLGQGLGDVKGRSNNVSGNGCALPRIRLRVKLGKDDSKSVVEAEVVRASVADDRVEEDKVQKEKPGSDDRSGGSGGGADGASIVNLSPADKDSEGTVVSSASVGGLDADSVVVEASREGGNENEDREAAASPDSEVSNFVPEGKHGGRSVAGNGSKVKPPKKRGGRVKCGGDACTDEIVASSASASGSTNSSSSKELTHEHIPFSGEIDVSKNDEDPEAQISLDGNLKSPELEDLEPPVATIKSKGQRRERKSNGASRRRSTTPASRNRQRSSGKKKGNEQKSAGKNKAKDKSDCVQVDKKEHDLEAGNCIQNEIEDVNVSSCLAPSNVAGLSAASSGITDQGRSLDNAWVRCDDCLKWRRISEELADSIGQTNCRWICGDNLDKAFAGCSIPQEMSNSEINAELGIPDADEEAFDVFSNSMASECSHTDSKEHEFVRISSNQFLHRSRKTQSIDEIMVCGCKPPLDGGLGCRDGCLNRVLNIECIPGTCPCGDLCSNQQFQKRSYAKMKWDRCGKKGFGLRLEEDISRGQFLIEYVGEVLDMRTYQARLKEYASVGHKHFYFMTLDGSEVIDACAKGNLGRFINHSCDPNCRTEKWLVNGEICIGLFALRDIKKGEEVTFDYNYVRVVGAAAKKCYCGSLQCRGYIGGDPINSDFVDQVDSDEEFPEPVMLEEGESLKGNMARTRSLDGVDMQVSEGVLKAGETVKPINTVGDLEIASEFDDSINQLPAHVADSKTSSLSSLPAEVPFQVEEASTRPLPAAQPEMPLEETISKTSCDILASETPLAAEQSNLPSDASKKLDKRVFVKSRFYLKNSDQSCSVKKGKHPSNQSNMRKAQFVAKRTEMLSWKPKKLMEVVANGRFEAVEEKLNELLDVDGGISRRKDAPRGYLQLLHLTAASGSNGNGETIQSNRDLSMLLDAILKTKSRTVLTDIIDKNVLQKLHNMMKQCRRDFKKMPILRKVLKVLEYLATREVLTLEHICKGPPHPGVESFIESMLSLTEHDDKQVHQIARNFRDRWIPRHVRKICFLDRDDERKKFSGAAMSTSQHHLPDQASKPTELADTLLHPEPPTSSVGAVHESCLVSFVDGVTKIRKRKTRWDQDKPVLISILEDEGIVNPGLMRQPESKRMCNLDGEPLDHVGKLREDGCYHHCVQSDTMNLSAGGGDTRKLNICDDVPPGFSSPHSKQVSSVGLLTDSDMPKQINPDGLVVGYPQKKFLSRLPISYGIPLPIVQQFGSLDAGNSESWIIAPGVVFHPFPPLPPVPRPNKEASCSVSSQAIGVSEAQRGGHEPTSYLAEDGPSTSDSHQCGLENASANLRHALKRPRGSSHDLGRRYFRQQKWNRPPPWIRNGTRWGYTGNNSRGGMCARNIGNTSKEHKALSFTEDEGCNVENTGNYFNQQAEQQNDHR